MNTSSLSCPYCGSTVRQTKDGHTTCGSQRYQCHACRKLYSPFPKEHGYPSEIRQTAVPMYLEGNGFR